MASPTAFSSVWSFLCRRSMSTECSQDEASSPSSTIMRRSNWIAPHVSSSLAHLFHDDKKGNPYRAALPPEVVQSILASYLHFDKPISDMIYVCGGRNESVGPLPSAEMFDTWYGRWIELPDMQTPRAGCASAPLQDKRVIVVGGYDGRGIVKGLLRSTDIYNPVTRTWTYGGELRRSRWGHGCAALGDYVYAVGGCSLLKNAPVQEQFMETLRVCEAYNVMTDEWIEVAPLNTCRAGSRLVAVGNRHIVAVGGCDDVFGRAEMLNTCEVYDAMENKWTVLETRLSIPRTTAAVAAISDWHVLVIGGAPNLKSSELISIGAPPKGTEEIAHMELQCMGGGRSFGYLAQGRMGCQAVSVTLPEDYTSFPGTVTGEGYRARKVVVVLGGEDGEDDEANREIGWNGTDWRYGKQFNTLEIFDTEARKWVGARLPPMLSRRTAMAACVSYGVVGGYP